MQRLGMKARLPLGPIDYNLVCSLLGQEDVAVVEAAKSYVKHLVGRMSAEAVGLRLCPFRAPEPGVTEMVAPILFHMLRPKPPPAEGASSSSSQAAQPGGGDVPSTGALAALDLLMPLASERSMYDFVTKRGLQGLLVALLPHKDHAVVQAAAGVLRAMALCRSRAAQVRREEEARDVGVRVVSLGSFVKVGAQCYSWVPDNYLDQFASEPTRDCNGMA